MLVEHIFVRLSSQPFFNRLCGKRSVEVLFQRRAIKCKSPQKAHYPHSDMKVAQRRCIGLLRTHIVIGVLTRPALLVRRTSLAAP